jgi:hypothetical protein
VSKSDPDLSPLLPDEATLKARRAALVDAVGSGGEGPRPAKSWRRRGPRLALVAATALAAVAVALVVSAGGGNAPAAFAVEPQAGGGVTIRIYSLEDASGLEEALEDAGIRAQVTWLPAGTVCREPHYKPSVVHPRGGGAFGGMTMEGPGGPLTIGIGSARRSRESLRQSFRKYRRGEISQEEMRERVPNLNLDPKAFRPDQSVVLSGTPVPYDGDPEGGSIAKIGVAEGPVAPCDRVPAPPSGEGSFGLGTGGAPGYTPRGDEALGQAAIAAALRQTARVAAASGTQVEAAPGPGRFLYEKTRLTELQGWLPKGHYKGSKTHPRYFVPIDDPSARYALVPTLKGVWTAPDGTTRVRETLGRVTFFSAADQRHWEEAGSPPPFAYDPSEHDVGRDSSGRPLKDYAAKAFRGRREFAYLAKLSLLPTEPGALRLTVEHRDGGDPPVAPSPADSVRGGATVARLLQILSEPLASPDLRAAAFDALAEIPDIGFERGVADSAGRRGDAIGWVREGGFGRRYIFDPHTAAVLAEGEVIFDARAAGYPGVPDGTAFRETAYLGAGIVGSLDRNPWNHGDDARPAGGIHREADPEAPHFCQRSRLSCPVRLAWGSKLRSHPAAEGQRRQRADQEGCRYGRQGEGWIAASDGLRGRADPSWSGRTGRRAGTAGGAGTAGRAGCRRGQG